MLLPLYDLCHTDLPRYTGYQSRFKHALEALEIKRRLK